MTQLRGNSINPYPLGAHIEGGGIRFSFPSCSDNCSLVLFDRSTGKRLKRIALSGEDRIGRLYCRFVPDLDASDVSYYFVSKEEFYEESLASKNAFRHELGIPLDKFVVFGDGQVQERKGIDDFVKMAEANPDVQFIWAGGFSFGKITDGYDHYKQMVDNPPKNLTFAGLVDRAKLVNYLNIADLFVLPSYDELFPMSVLEAFSCGTPVLLRDLDLYKAIIDGYYMSGKDFGEMNQVLQKAVKDPQLLKKYSELSNKASQEYSEERLAKIWNEFYHEQYKLGKELGQIR